MSSINLKAGENALIRGNLYDCNGRGPGGKSIFVNQKNGSQLYLSPHKIYELYEEGKFKHIDKNMALPVGSDNTNFHFDISSIKSSKEKQEVLNRLHYMKGIHIHLCDGGTLSNCSLEPTLQLLHLELIKKNKTDLLVTESKCMSCSAAKRWYKSWNESGQEIITLVKEYRGNSKSRLALEVREVIEDIINTRYLSPQRITVKYAHMLIKLRIKALNLEREEKTRLTSPSYQTILNYTSELDKFDVLAARYTHSYAVEATRAHGITPSVTRNLDRVQMDHTPLDIHVDMGEKKPLKPHLTLALDAYSKAILGYWISINPPSADSVMNCLKMTILPKNLKSIGGEQKWEYPMHGLPLELTLDNGKDFHSKDLEVTCAQLGISLNYTPPRQAYYKSQIERKFGELNTSLLINMKGRVFKDEPEKRGEDYTYFTLDQVKQFFLQWVTTILHKTPNKEGKSPCDLWFESESKYGTTGLAFEEEFLAQTISKTEVTHKLGRDGIRHLNLKFSSDALALYRRSLKQPHARNPNVTFKWSASDVGSIWVLDEHQNRYFKVLATEPLSHGRSLYNHKVVRREIRIRRDEKLNDDTYLDAVNALDNLIQDAVNQKTAKSTSRAYRYKSGQPSKQIFGDAIPLDKAEPIKYFDEKKMGGEEQHLIENNDLSNDINDDISDDNLDDYIVNFE